MECQKRKIVAGLGAAVVSVAALVLFLYRLGGHWGDVLRVFRRAEYTYLLPALGFLAVAYCLRMARWRMLLKPISDVKWFNIISATVIGFATNNVLPARLGELVRPYLISRREDVDFSHAMGTVALARVFDLMGLALLLLLAGIAVVPQQATTKRAEPTNQITIHRDSPVRGDAGVADGDGVVENERTRGIIAKVWLGGIIMSCVGVLGLLMLLVMALWPDPIRSLGKSVISILPQTWHPRCEETLESLFEALGCLKSGRAVMSGLGMSGGIWLCQALSTWMLMWNLNLGVGVEVAFLVTLAIAAAVAIPQGPGYLGTFHLAAALAAEGFDVPTGAAGAFAMLVWLVNVIPITAAGVVFLIKEGLSPGELQTESRHRERGSEGEPGGPD